MAFNPRNSQHQQSEVLVKVSKSSLMICGLLLLSLGVMLYTKQSHATEPNLYEKNYQEQNSSHLKSLDANPDTKMYLSNHKEDDNISMLENGYDMIGSSSFEGAAVPVEGALELGRAIKADTVLVYSKYAPTKTAISKIQLVKEAAKHGGEIEAKDFVDEPTRHKYYASYWAKLPMPILGVHVIKLKQKTNDDEVEKSKVEPGLKVIAVIKSSPAAISNIFKDDVLLSIGDVALDKPDDLFTAVQRYAGQTIMLKVGRNGTLMNIDVALNARKK